jgi:hypothetical protein
MSDLINLVTARATYETSYVPGPGVSSDHQGGSLRARLFNGTSVELTPAIASNAGNSSA